jgi:hypothetical protein
MSTGPFLYDDDPAPLHTGTPRRSGKLLVAIFGGTAVVAVLMVAALPLVKGTGAEQARESVGVFLAALEQGDTTTAHQLLCAEERGRVTEADVAATYVGGERGRVTGVEGAAVDGETVQQVRIAWDDGSFTTVDVINEEGPRVCGISSAG